MKSRPIHITFKSINVKMPHHNVFSPTNFLRNSNTDIVGRFFIENQNRKLKHSKVNTAKVKHILILWFINIVVSKYFKKFVRL